MPPLPHKVSWQSESSSERQNEPSYSGGGETILMSHLWNKSYSKERATAGELTEMSEAKCSVCGEDYNFYDLFCMISQRGANSLCKDHLHELICMKCGGFEVENLRCPHCKSPNISFPTRFSAEGGYHTIRQCYSCLRVFNPDGTEILVKEK